MTYPPEVGANPTGNNDTMREAVLHVMKAASFLVFFQAYLVAPLNPSRRGLAMGLNSFSLFTGFGLGALAFEPLMKYGFNTALAVFALIQMCLAILAVPLIRGEDSSAGGHSLIPTATR